MTCKKCGCVAPVIMANGLCYHCNHEEFDLLEESEVSLYAIMRKSDKAFLNIRRFASNETPIFNSYKEKRFWIDSDINRAQAQVYLLDDCIVVKLNEVL